MAGDALEAGPAGGPPDRRLMAGGAFEAARTAVRPPDAAVGAAAAEHHRRLAKPPGSLGRLEAAGVQLSAIAGAFPPPVPAPAAVAVFAGDHGVVAEGVTPWPQEVTAQMVATFLAGGAAVNVLARQAGARVAVVDVGVATPLPDHPQLWARRLRPGTGNLRTEPAMSRAEAAAALDVGAEVAARLVAEGARALVTGDMGIGNTTPSAALVAVLTGRSPVEVTGRGTGIDDATWARKVSVVEDALARAAALLDPSAPVGALAEVGGPEIAARAGPPGQSDPLAVVAEVGGLEIAALAGFVVGGAAARVPVVVDGVIAQAALLVAAALCPPCLGYCFAGHRSAEPGSRAALEHLGLEPLLDLDLRLGEGTGAVLALPLLEAAARVLAEMATLDAAGVTPKGG
jgi:nicotinate-nucleotide--dimethylbenzimidazole phosphoribosyltransferase